MNVAQTITAREKGLRVDNSKDIALLRLKCICDNSYEESHPLIQDFYDYYPKPSILVAKFASAPGNQQLLALANEDGEIALQNTISQKFNLIKEKAHENVILDMAWKPKDMQLITASGDWTLNLWDISLPALTKVQTFRGHTHSVKSAVFRHEDNAVFATGGRDGVIMIWDIRASHNGQPKADDVITDAHDVKSQSGSKLKHSNSKIVTALAFQDDYTLFSSSAGDGIIKGWDLRKTYSSNRKEPIPKYTLNYAGTSCTYNGFTSLAICPYGIKLYASGVDKNIYSYNISSYNSEPAIFYGHGESNRILSFFVKACLSPDGEYLASGSNDEIGYIWNTKRPGLPFVELCGHRDEVTCMAFCEVGSKIVTCSDDSHYKIWDVKPDADDEDDIMNNFHFIRRYQEGEQYLPGDLHSGKHVDLSSIAKHKMIVSPMQEILESPKRTGLDIRTAIRKLHFDSPTSTMMNGRETRHSEESTSIPDVSENDSQPSHSRTPLFVLTMEWPNFVLDGTAPHLLANSPRKPKSTPNFSENWLTKLGKRKTEDQSIYKDALCSPKLRKTPTHRTKRVSRSTDLRKTPKSLQSLSPAITNFCRNLNNAKA